MIMTRFGRIPPTPGKSTLKWHGIRALATCQKPTGQPLATGKGTVGPLPPSGMGNGFDLGAGAGTAAIFKRNSPNEKFLRIVEGNRKVGYDASNMIIPQAVQNR
jgi:hypothetical protein